MNKFRKLIRKEIKNVLKEERETIGNTTFSKDKDYQISEKALKSLYNWQWNSNKLREYQNKGLDAIDDDVVEELKQYRPNSSVWLWRWFDTLKGELQSKQNELLSFTPDKGVALSAMERYVQLTEFQPDEILVMTNLIPGEKPVDLITEAIVINKRDWK